MRRAEFVCDDLGLITSHLDEIQYGVMSIPDTPLPYALPLSFCYLPAPPSSQIGTTNPAQTHDTSTHSTLCATPPHNTPSCSAQKGAIGIHGAKAGRKFALLKQNPQVCFSATKPYAYIGSEFLGGAMIPTQFFFCVMIAGQFRVVEDNALKREILGALVRKYEPQSENFSFSKKEFAGSERGVFVGFIEIEHLSVKAKFGQNLKQSEFESILSDLQAKYDSIYKNLGNACASLQSLESLQSGQATQTLQQSPQSLQSSQILQSLQSLQTLKQTIALMKHFAKMSK